MTPRYRWRLSRVMDADRPGGQLRGRVAAQHPQSRGTAGGEVVQYGTLIVSAPKAKQADAFLVTPSCPRCYPWAQRLSRLTREQCLFLS
jgi:hypothetical protein